MKKIIQLVFLASVFLTVVLSGCSPASTPIPATFTSSPMPPTNTPEPSSTPSPTFTPSPSPTPIGGLSGKILFVQKEFQESLYPYQFTESLHSMVLPNGEIEDLITNENFGAAVGKMFDSLHIAASPNGNRALIYACSLRQGTSCILGPYFYLVSTDLQSITELNLDKNMFIYGWSPDSQRLMWKKSRNSLGVIDQDGSVSGPLATLDLYDGIPSWSPDGSRIYWFNAKTGLWSVPADGTTKKESHPDEAMKSTYSISISFSGDGNKVAFVVFKDNEEQVVIANADFSNPIPLPFKVDLPFKYPSVIVGGEEVYSSSEFWLSSTGKYLLMDGCLGQVLSGSCEKKAPLILIDVDLNEQTLLDEADDIEVCGFSPDDWIVFVMPGYNANGYLELVDAQQAANESARYRIPYTGGCPIWLP